MDNISNRKRHTNNKLANNSALIGRSRLAAKMGKTFAGKRDMYEVLGYKTLITYDDYLIRYRRDHLAQRIVNQPAAATWRNIPNISDDGNQKENTPFEESFKLLVQKKNLLKYFERLDRLMGIGRYSVMLLGIRGQNDLSQPLEKGSLNGIDDIIYFSVFGEKNAQIKSWVTDASDPRFGLPEMYQINFTSEEAVGRTGIASMTRIVHHSRLIHAADGVLEDEIFGYPRLEKVYNLFDDIMKVVGGSAEMFWQGAYHGLHADVRDSDNVVIDKAEKEEMSNEMDEYLHGLRRYIKTQGIDIKTLGGSVADSKNHFDVIMSLVSGATNIPKRILMGSEAGQLASAQDETNYNTYIKERQVHLGEQEILRPAIDKFVELGIMPEPKQDYTVEWPNLFELSTKEKAEVADKKASAIQKYAPFGETERVMPIQEFREKVLEVDAEIPEEYAIKDDLNLDEDIETPIDLIERRERIGK